MAINRLVTLLLIMSLLSSVVLLGCQTNNFQTAKVTKVASRINTQALSQQELLQTLTNYEWQLVQIKDINNKTKPFNYHPPLLMQVIPNRLLFSEGCHTYQSFFNETYQRPYAYRLSPPIDGTNKPCTDGSDSDTRAALTTLIKPYVTEFRFDWLSKPNTPAKIALIMNNGVALIFDGRAKPDKKMLGLPITNELLEYYNWRLMSVADKEDQIIERFNQPDVPIISRFTTDEYRRFARYSVSCNGAGGPYALTDNYKLLIGGAPSTMISCGERMDKIESDFRRLISYSQSQLVLTKTTSNTNNADTNDKSHYQLVQKMDSGETLVWESEEKN
ncbi:hypothetical protein [uncultured Psychrobacter sp.]|uniref:hypothetical protein n=1 Tax=uncultured Psychrobacter sp. TaxID=259303 RepID=UPI003459B7C0